MQTFKVICVALLCVAVIALPSEKHDCDGNCDDCDGSCGHKNPETQRPELEWWENAVFYQIYPRSFKDSNGDGVGDLNGITSKLDYLKELGITGVWLSPIFKSPMADFGYDISDYRQIHHEFGTLDDFDRLAAHCRALGIRLILDFVPNHTSNKHEWFLKSVKKEGEYADYYMWHPGKMVNGTRQPPSNWIGTFRFSAWTWVEERKEYYLHQFLPEQPDLNYRNPKVVEAMKDVLRYWMDRGVSGFRCDAVPTLFETEVNKTTGLYDDEEKSGNCDDPQSYCYLRHDHTYGLNETYDMIYQWRTVTDEYKAQHGGDTRYRDSHSHSTTIHSIEGIDQTYNLHFGSEF